MYEYFIDKPILLPVKQDTYKPVRLKDILYAEVNGAYIVVHYVNGSSEPFATSLAKLEEKLPPHLFCRVSRNYFISIYNVDIVEKGSVKIGNQILPLSDNFKKEFLSRFYLGPG
jgi:two-component system, LytTR family, response regulator